MKLSQNSLMKALSEMQLEPILEPGTDQVYILLTIAQREIPIFFGIRSGGTLLQTIAYLPYDLPEQTMAQVGRLLHILNLEIDMPGWGMDETQKLMFYRSVMPCPNGDFNPKLLELYLATTRIVCETFMDAIAMIAGGVTTLEKALEHLKKKRRP